MAVRLVAKSSKRVVIAVGRVVIAVRLVRLVRVSNVHVFQVEEKYNVYGATSPHSHGATHAHEQITPRDAKKGKATQHFQRNIGCLANHDTCSLGDALTN